MTPSEDLGSHIGTVNRVLSRHTTLADKLIGELRVAEGLGVPCQLVAGVDALNACKGARRDEVHERVKSWQKPFCAVFGNQAWGTQSPSLFSGKYAN